MNYLFKILLILSLILPAFVVAQKKQDKPKQKLAVADSLFEEGDYKGAITYYESAATLYKNSSKDAYIHCENKVADCQVRQGQLDEALELTDNMLRESATAGQKAELNTTMGLIYLNKGRYDVALDYFNKALAYYKKQEKKTEEDAYCYNNLALTYWTTGNNQLALEHMNEALDIRKELYKENHPLVAASYNNLGLVYSDLDLKAAMENYKKALDIYTKLYKSSHPVIATTYNNIGIIQRKQADYNNSLVSFKQCLAMRISLLGAEHANVAFVYSSIGQTFSDLGKYDSALVYQQKALAIYKTVYGDKHPEVANTYNLIGSALEQQKKYDLALDNFQEALCTNSPGFNDKNVLINPSINNYYNANLLLVSLLLKARALESRHYGETLKLDDLKLSLATLELCDSLIVKIRQLRTSKADKLLLGKTASEIYEDAVSVAFTLSEITLKKKYYLEKAFIFSEKNKASVLQESIADAEAKSFAGIPKELLEDEKELKSDITFYEQKLAEGPSKEQEKLYRVKLFTVNRKYDDFIKGLEKKYPGYYNLKYNQQQVSIDSIRKALNKETVLLSYFIAEGRKKLYTFVLTDKKLKAYEITKDEFFDKDVKAFRNAITHQVDEAYIAFARTLYKQLVPMFPFMPNLYKDRFPKLHLTTIKKLVIIPEGSLGSMPFEALLVKKVKEENKGDFTKLPYLVNYYSVSYDYSATLFMQAQKESNAYKRKPSVFLCAPVTFNASLKLAPLLGSETEVKSIDSLFDKNGNEAKVYLNKKATEEVVKSPEIKKYKYLHFATHGIVNEEKPELSEIYLSPKDDEDGNLYSGEIYNLNINADLVTLSACQTGLGKVSKGEGIIGLTRALLYAGSNNLLVSLWSVADRSTSNLMVNFYDNLIKSKGTDYSSALRESKLKLISDNQFSRPYYWAPFILIGK